MPYEVIPLKELHWLTADETIRTARLEDDKYSRKVEVSNQQGFFDTVASFSVCFCGHTLLF